MKKNNLKKKRKDAKEKVTWVQLKCQVSPPTKCTLKGSMEKNLGCWKEREKLWHRGPEEMHRTYRDGKDTLTVAQLPLLPSSKPASVAKMAFDSD
ncbi:hypothetical protein A6R68_01586, partial [Neotoma lepida]